LLPLQLSEQLLHEVHEAQDICAPAGGARSANASSSSAAVRSTNDRRDERRVSWLRFMTRLPASEAAIEVMIQDLTPDLSTDCTFSGRTEGSEINYRGSVAGMETTIRVPSPVGGSN